MNHRTTTSENGTVSCVRCGLVFSPGELTGLYRMPPCQPKTARNFIGLMRCPRCLQPANVEVFAGDPPWIACSECGQRFEMVANADPRTMQAEMEDA